MHCYSAIIINSKIYLIKALEQKQLFLFTEKPQYIATYELSESAEKALTNYVDRLSDRQISTSGSEILFPIISSSN